jgi:hypothetical protein
MDVVEIGVRIPYLVEVASDLSFYFHVISFCSVLCLTRVTGDVAYYERQMRYQSKSNRIFFTVFNKKMLKCFFKMLC